MSYYTFFFAFSRIFILFLLTIFCILFIQKYLGPIFFDQLFENEKKATKKLYISFLSFLLLNIKCMEYNKRIQMDSRRDSSLYNVYYNIFSILFLFQKEQFFSGFYCNCFFFSIYLFKLEIKNLLNFNDMLC